MDIKNFCRRPTQKLTGRDSFNICNISPFGTRRGLIPSTWVIQASIDPPWPANTMLDKPRCGAVAMHFVHHRLKRTNKDGRWHGIIYGMDKRRKGQFWWRYRLGVWCVRRTHMTTLLPVCDVSISFGQVSHMLWPRYCLLCCDERWTVLWVEQTSDKDYILSRAIYDSGNQCHVIIKGLFEHSKEKHRNRKKIIAFLYKLMQLQSRWSHSRKLQEWLFGRHVAKT